MSVAWRYRSLRLFDFSDVSGCRAEWVEMSWEQLPLDIRSVLKQLT